MALELFYHPLSSFCQKALIALYENETLFTRRRLVPEDPWTGRRGRITAEWIKEHITDLPNTVFYACGPNALVDATEHLVLHDLGVPKAQMKTEKWG